MGENKIEKKCFKENTGLSSKETESGLPYAQMYPPSSNQGAELYPNKLPNYHQN